MLRLYWFHTKRILRGKEELFWALIFPLVMATLFYASFGSGVDLEEMNAIPVAAVRGENVAFTSFLQAMDGDTLAVQEMEEGQALLALSEGEIDGIFYCEKEPSLTVVGTQLPESILGALLEGYLQNASMLEEIGKTHPLKLPAAIAAMSDSQSFIQNVTTQGNVLDNNLTYFFGLIGMACLFGAFMGLTSAMNLRADQSALAARRSVAPTHRRTMVVSELLAAFTIQFFNICILLLYLHFALGISFGEKWYLLLPVCILGSVTGVAYGIFLGSLHLSEGYKTACLVGSSLLMSFLAGMMFANMKDIVAHHAPFLSKINPAALIADAFYSISVYENPSRYLENLALLAIIALVLVTVSFVRLGRERYDSL